MFGMKRGEYKPYSEYKKSKSNDDDQKQLTMLCDRMKLE